MAVQHIRLAETSVWRRTHSNDKVPVPNVDFPGSKREVDRDVISLHREYQSNNNPNNPNYYDRDPFANYSSLQKLHEERYATALKGTMDTYADKQHIQKRESDLMDVRHAGMRAHNTIDASVKIYDTASAVGHGLAGVFAIPTFGISIGASAVNHGVQVGILKSSLAGVKYKVRSELSSQAIRNHADAARQARDRNAPNIVRIFGQDGRTYIEETSRLTDSSVQRYITSFNNLGDVSKSTQSALHKAGITDASVEAELARIAETRLAGAGVLSTPAYYGTAHYPVTLY
jgi:hypothetical protein